MADIIPFAESHATLVRSWIDTERTWRQLGGRGAWPPSDDLISGRQLNAMKSFLLLSRRLPVAYAELWPRPAQLAVEVKFLLVDPQHRNEGYGSRMLRLLWEEAGQRRGVARVILRLDEGDRRVLGCYLRAGFQISGASVPSGLTLEKMIVRTDSI